jgi:glycosyltransferase involved in cell wall biosynthesis
MKRALLIHVPYDWPGGEDHYLERLHRAYRSLGFEVKVYPASEEVAKDFRTAAASIVAERHAGVEKVAREFAPDVIHLNNIFPSLGPALLGSLNKLKIPTIQTAHNHRIFCTNGLAFRAEKICELCANKPLPWRGAAYNCNGDLKKSAYYAAVISKIRIKGLWHRAINAWIAPSPYMAEMLAGQGIPRDRIHLQSHALDAVLPPAPERKYDFVYAGRMSREKGVESVLALVEAFPEKSFVLMGDGPLGEVVANAAARQSNLTFLPNLPRDEVLRTIQQSRTGLLLSRCYESFSFFAFECMASGLNMVVPDLKATRWLSEAPRFAILADTYSLPSMKAAIDKACAAALPSAGEVEGLRAGLTEEVFAVNLSSLLSALGAAPR